MCGLVQHPGLESPDQPHPGCAVPTLSGDGEVTASAEDAVANAGAVLDSAPASCQGQCLAAWSGKQDSTVY